MSKITGLGLMIVFFILFACNQQDYTPKPSGYLRTDFPQKQYLFFDKNLPYSFEYPAYGSILKDTVAGAEPYWINIEFPQFKAKIHLSYKKVNGKPDIYIEDARKLAYKHTIKADAIEESIIEDSANHKYGILYDIEGNTASSVQFFVSDYKKHFLRGALYFSSSPNKDSLAPSIVFFRKDIERLITSLKWKN
jgi:gliding motility-associated lipoprotein GldD